MTANQHLIELQEDWWIAGLKLSSDDLERLLTGMDLTDTLINAAQSILQRQFSGCSGFQDVALGTLHLVLSSFRLYSANYTHRYAFV